MTRADAIDCALTFFDDKDNGYLAELSRLCGVPTESQNPARLPEMMQYLEEFMSPRLEALGYTIKIYDNPIAGSGPVLLASRVEDAGLPTILCYGHGDVVLGMEGQWGAGRGPWELTIEGEKVFGRGVADNKGQHLIQIAALDAVLAKRGKLGFNHKFLIEMGEENGSKGLMEIVEANRSDFATDAFFASDGPRTEMTKPNITLGNRGACNFNLVVDLRSSGHHSGNWGGLLANPAIILANALASIADRRGKVLVPEWRPEVADHIRALLKDVDRDAGADAPEIDDDWGEPGLHRMEKVSTFNTFEVLAFTSGTPDRPVNAIPPTARATCQLRYIYGTDEDDIVTSLRRHLDANGFERVKIEPPPSGNDGRFMASRTDPHHPWAQWMQGAVARGSNHPCSVLPTSGGSNMTHIIQSTLDAPITWFPLSYGGCSQHAPDEHILLPLMREGMRHVTSIYWDLGDPETAYRL